METGYKLFKKKYLSAEMLKEKSFGIEPEITIKLAKKSTFFSFNCSDIISPYQKMPSKVFPLVLRILTNS